MRVRCTVLWALLLMVAALPAAGQVAIVSRPAPPSAERSFELPRTTLRVEAATVLVPVVVADPMNRPITGLAKQHFRVFDDDVEQTVTIFAMEDAPVAVGLVFDTSGSMNEKMRMARRAAAEFFRTANPEDEFFLVQFNNKPKLVAPLPTAVEQIQSCLASAKPNGRTALLDALVLSLHELKKSNVPRRALLIISDGGDNASRYSENEVKDLVRESDALIYAVGVYGRGGTLEELAGPSLLEEITKQTGGRLITASIGELADIASKIGLEMRNRYLLGFAPTDSRRDGKYHSLRVTLNAPRGLPKLRASWRRGYYAPTQ